MASEEQVLQEIHFRDMLQELKESVQEEVSNIVHKKLTAWQSSISSSVLGPGLATQISTGPSSIDSNAISREHPPGDPDGQASAPLPATLTASDRWAPDYSRATQQLEKTNTLTRALTRSHFRIGPASGSRMFVSRPSLLTELLQVTHIGSLYNIFVAILCLMLVQKLMEEAIVTGSVNLELHLMAWCFGQLEIVIVIWLGMFVACSVGLYSGLQCWANNRHKNPRVYDKVFGSMLVLFLCLLLYVPTSYLLQYDLPLASSFIVLCEQVRFLMKSWAFVRSNIPRALRDTSSGDNSEYKKTDGDPSTSANNRAPCNENSEFKKTDSETNSGDVSGGKPAVAAVAVDKDAPNTRIPSKCPSFSQHLYFLFAPTLVYRDDYPRNASISWAKVATDLAQVMGCIFYIHFLVVRFCVPVFQKFGTSLPFSGSQLLVSVFSCCFPASLVLLCAFFALLHAWMNAFAEMMRFSDRMFYKDWWNSTSYSRFYRTWNCVVHDWLYEYVYRELYTDKAVATRLQRHLPLLLVFFISSVVHEYILALAFRFFYPVLLVMFGGFGVLFMFIKTRARHFNVCLWISLILGTGILMCLYSLEWYARRNCTPVYEGVADYFVPRSWFCESMQSNAVILQSTSSVNQLSIG